MFKAYTDKQQVGVCIASMAFYPLYAGPALRFQRYGPGLRRRGVALRVFTQAVTPALIQRDGSISKEPLEQNENGSQVDLLPPETEIVDGMLVQRVALPAGRLREPAYFRFLVEYCRQHRQEIDVVQLLNADFLAAPWLLQLRRMGLKIVFTHTLLADFSPNRLKRSLQRFHRRLPLDLVDTVVVSSQEMQRQVLKLNTRTPVVVIPNGVDLKRFQPAGEASQRESIRRELGWSPNWTVILAIGPIIPRKGTDALVEAFTSLHQEFPNSRLVLVGPRHDIAREDLQDFHRRLDTLIDGAGARDKVIFTGPVSDVQPYLQAADLLIFPSRREGMPNVVPEAMAAGLPVLMTPFTGLPSEFGTPGNQYLLSSWEPADMGSNMRWLLKDAALRHALGQSARAWVTCHLDLEQSLDAYQDLYRWLAQKRN